VTRSTSDPPRSRSVSTPSATAVCACCATCCATRFTRAIGDEFPLSAAIVPRAFVVFVAERFVADFFVGADFVDDGVLFFAEAERAAGRRDVDFFAVLLRDERLLDERFDVPRAELPVRFAPPFFPRDALLLRDLPPDFLARVAMANSPHGRCDELAMI
jgi:hypothetical protein